jgi:integrase
MGLRCKAHGCMKVVKECKCKRTALRFWQMDYWVGVDGAKERRHVTTDRQLTRTDAEKEYARLRFAARENRTSLLPPADRSIRDAIEAFIDFRVAKVRAKERRPATLSNHQGICENYLAPCFGSARLSSITPATVQDFCTNLRERLPDAVVRARVASYKNELGRLGFGNRHGEEAMQEKLSKAHERVSQQRLSARTVRMIMDTLALVLDQAVLKGWITNNPARAVPRDISGKSKKRFPLTAEEMLQVEELTRFAPSATRLPILLMGWCGLRRGEAFGLQRRDLDRVTGELRIARILDREGLAGPVKGSKESDTDDDEATVVPPPWLFAELVEHVTSLPVVADGSDWMFVNRRGRPIKNNQTRFWDEKVRPGLVARATERRAAKLRQATFHHLRYSYSSAMKSDPMLRKAMMRHASLEMTSHYTQPPLEARREVVATLPVPDRCETAAGGRVQ